MTMTAASNLGDPVCVDAPGNADPVGHREDSIGHLNGAGHQHDHIGYANGQGHQKFHGECEEHDEQADIAAGDLGGDPVCVDGPGNADPVGHREDSTGHLNGAGHHHDHIGYANGEGHQKFHGECEDDHAAAEEIMDAICCLPPPDEEAPLLDGEPLEEVEVDIFA